MRFHEKDLDRPIFIIGSAKSGTTLLGLIISWHEDVGPKPEIFREAGLQKAIDTILLWDHHKDVAIPMEKKQFWDHYLPVGNVALRQGKELILFKNPLNQQLTRELKNILGNSCSEKRLFQKQPFNTFRVHVIREIFPDAKIIAIHRDGRDVISSWGTKLNRWVQFGGYEKSIRLFSEKWIDAVLHIEKYKKQLDIFTLRYEDLVLNPASVIKNVFDFAELQYLPAIFNSLVLVNNHGKWKNEIPMEYHDLLMNCTLKGLNALGYVV